MGKKEQIVPNGENLVSSKENEPIQFSGGQAGPDGKVALTFKHCKGWREKLKGTFGTDIFDTLSLLSTPLIKIVDPQGEDRARGLNSITPILRSIGPTDELEGMLAMQMVGTHFMVMELMARAMHPKRTDESANYSINQAAKLSRTFIAQLEALNKHRGRGGQRVRVEHVHVNEGGQAVIGNVDRGGGKDEK